MTVDTVVKEVIEAVYQQPLEKRREYLFSLLMELSTSLSGSLFDDAVGDMQKHWAEQVAQNS